MKFVCEKRELAAALSIASRTVSQRSTLYDLEGIFLRAEEALYLTGYNMETGITVRVEAEISEEGMCVLPARLFFDIIRKMPEDMVRVEVDLEGRVNVTCGPASYVIQYVSSGDDYPELPQVGEEKDFSLPQSAMKELISGTIFAVSENQAQPIHTGCLMEVRGDAVNMVAVDGYRLARRTFHTDTLPDKDLTFVVPAVALRELEKILQDTEDEVDVTVGRKHLLFRVGGVTLVCRVLEGNFLDWRRVVPTNNPIKLVADVSTLTATIERVSLVVSEKIKTPVRCRLQENQADFRTKSPQGSAHDVCPLAGNGKDMEIGFNSSYLLDALKAVPTEEVTLEVSNGLSPFVLTPVDAEHDFAYMVLPVRLKAGE